jgi:hypothetical protein
MPGPVFWFFGAVGLATLATAVRFALSPAERTLAVLRSLSAATACAALAAFFAGVTNGLVGLAHWLERAPDAAASAKFWPAVLTGFAESPIALIIGFALLSVTWLLVAVGLRRQA